MVKEYHFSLNEDEYSLFDKKFVEPLDLHNNNGSGNELAFVISTFNKTWDDKDPNGDTYSFYRAIEFAETILKEVIKSIKSLAKAKQISTTYPPEGDVIYLDRYIPIGEFLVNTPINFIGSPSKRGGYQITSVKSENGGNKKLFPEKYRDFNDINNPINGMTFCNHSGFLASFVTKDDAKRFMNTI